MGKTNLVSTCFVITFVYDTHIMIKPIIYFTRPTRIDDRQKLHKFDNAFDAKRYIVANLGNEITVRTAA